MDAISPRQLNFRSDAGSPRRPSSRASSTGTEVPGAPRSLAREIEHIKTLIHRANVSSSSNESSITATIFRWGVQQQPSVTQAHILHELDALKRRIRAETRPVSRRQIDDDPETETESEQEDVVDERDEELDSARAAHEQSEIWVEAAEYRVDQLTEEKEDLQTTLQTREQELKAATNKYEELLSKQKQHESTIAELKSTHAKQFQTSNDTRVKDVERERDSATRDLEDKDSYIKSLEQDVKDLKAELAAARNASAEQEKQDRLAQVELRQQHDEELDQMRRSMEQSLSKEKLKTEEEARSQREVHERQLSDEKQKHSLALTTAERQLSEETRKHNLALETAERQLSEETQKHNLAMVTAKREYDDAMTVLKAEAGTRQQEHERQLSDQMQEHTSAMETTKRQHDEALTASKVEADDRQEQHERQLSSQAQEHNSAMEAMQRQHEASMNAVKAGHSSAVAGIKTRHNEELQSSQDKVAGEIRELRSSYEAKIQQQQEQRETELRDSHEKHESEKKGMMEAHETEMTASQERSAKSYSDLESKHNDAVKTHKTEVRALQEEHAKTREDLDSKHNDASEAHKAEVTALQEEFASTRNDLESKYSNAVAAHKAELNTVREEHMKAHRDLESKHNDELEANKAEMATLREEHTKHRNDLEAKYSDVVEAHKAEMGAVLKEHVKTLTDLKTKHTQILEANKAELSALREEHTKTLSDLQSKHNDATKAIRDEHAETTRRTAADHEASLTNLKQAHDEELSRIAAEKEQAAKENAEEAATDRNLIVDRHAVEREKWQTSIAAMEQDLKLRVQNVQQVNDVLTEELEEHFNNKISELETELKKQQSEHEQRLGEMETRHREERDTAAKSVQETEEKLKQQRTTHEQNWDAIENRHREEKEAATKSSGALQEQLKQQQISHEETVAATESRHLQEKQAAAKSAEDALQQAADKHAAEIAQLKEAHKKSTAECEEKIRNVSETANKQYEALKKSQADTLQQSQKDFNTEVSKLTQKHKDDVQEAKKQHTEALESASRLHLEHLNDIELKHHETLAAVQDKLDKSNSDLAALQRDLKKLANVDAEVLVTSEKRFRHDHESQMKSLREEHESQLKSLRAEHLSNVAEIERKHQETLQNTSENASRSAQDATEAAHTTLQERIGESTAKLQSQHKEKLEKIEAEHTKAIVDYRSQYAASQSELESYQQHTADLAKTHADEITRLLSDHDLALAKLKDRTQGSSSMQKAGTTAAHDSSDSTRDITVADSGDKNAADLRSQPDILQAEILEHHQARNHLEGMLQQKTHEVIQAQEESRQSQRKTTTLELELKQLRTTHERTEHTLRDLQETVVEHANLSTDETFRIQDELRRLRTQIDAAQKEKAAVESDINSKSTERAELAAQNEFLTKQLSELGGLMNGSTKPKYASRGMQTAPRIEVLGSPKRSHRRNVSLQDEATEGSSPSRSKRSSVVFGPELGHSIIGSPLARTHQLSIRPSTPTNPIISAIPSNGSPANERRRTLQDYLQKSEAPLFEAGSVATANEALLARKIQEHVGDMQKARDSLAKEFQERFDALLRAKERLDKQVTLEQAADFVKEREQMAAEFLSGEQEEVMPGVPRPKTIQAAEHRLVQKYNRRIAKKKSQIRLKHAEDFHNLTQDYDRHLADLLYQKSELEGDLGLGQSAVDSDETVKEQKVMRGDIAADTNGDAASKLPKRSIPRHKTSIPRMASFTKDKEVLQVVKPRTDRSPLRPLAQESPDSDYAGDAEEFEKHGRGLKRQSGSPNIKADTTRTSSLQISNRSLSSSSERSKRHSSAMLYAKERS